MGKLEQKLQSPALLLSGDQPNRNKGKEQHSRKIVSSPCRNQDSVKGSKPLGQCRGSGAVTTHLGVESNGRHETVTYKCADNQQHDPEGACGKQFTKFFCEQLQKAT